jgi:hypothetical protein
MGEDSPVAGMTPNSVGKGFSQPVFLIFSTSAFVHAPKPWDISTYPLDGISLYEIDSEDIEALYNKSCAMAHHLVASVADTTTQVQLQYLHADADIIRMKGELSGRFEILLIPSSCKFGVHSTIEPRSFRFIARNSGWVSFR